MSAPRTSWSARASSPTPGKRPGAAVDGVHRRGPAQVPVLPAGPAGQADPTPRPARPRGTRPGDDQGRVAARLQQPGGTGRLHLSRPVRGPRPDAGRHCGAAGGRGHRPRAPAGPLPALDLDSLYGLGPDHRFDRRFYEDDGLRLRTGTTQGLPDPGGDHLVGLPLGGFDLPRVGQGSRISERRRPLIPDGRNDENLVVAQIHSAFIRFHNRVVADLVGKGVSSAVLFETARETVVKHYQWMLRHDFLPRIVDPGVVDEVFTKGRRFFEPALGEHERPTMPVEFSVAAYRLGHSMVRGAYNWNRIFDKGAGTLPLLFRFTGTSGILSPPPADAGDPEAGTFERLPPTGSPTSDACSTSARRAATTWGSLRRSSTSPSGSTPSWSIRWPICRSARSADAERRLRPDRAEPGLPQPHPGEHDEPGDRSADGQVPRGEAAPAVRLRERGRSPAQRGSPQAARRELPAVVLHPARGRGERQRAADGRRRAHRRRGVPPRNGGQPVSIVRDPFWRPGGCRVRCRRHRTRGGHLRDGRTRHPHRRPEHGPPGGHRPGGGDGGGPSADLGGLLGDRGVRDGVTGGAGRGWSPSRGRGRHS
ncbi:hypothetical protein SALBM311S_10150 [Streptomyces alboniger]